MSFNRSGKGLTRRDFLVRSGAGAVTLPILFNGLPMKAFDGPRLQRLFNTTEESDRVLVLIQLNGGNDGLNTVIPLDQYDTYQQIRSNIAIPEAAAIKVTDDAAFHPSWQSLGELYSEQKVGVIQGVNYPNPNQSHFRSNDIWMSGSASDVSLPSGWLGRYLSTIYPGYPDGYPNTTMPDPVAIQMSAIVSLLLMGPESQQMGMALQDPETFYQLVNGTDTPGSDLPLTSYARENVEYVREVQVKSLEYSAVIKAAADKATNLVEYPEANQLAAQLQIVARLIAGGLKTRAYVVQLGGFDTHAAQVDEADPTIGAHAGLLKLVNDAVMSFQRDLEAHRVDDRVVTMTFSEFGRRPYSNLSFGTDHGTAAPMFFFGTPVQDGVTGVSPDLEDLDRENLKIQFDFRQIYASVLEQWFGASATEIQQILFGEFSTVRVIKAGTTSVPEQASTNDHMELHRVAPNPVHSSAEIRYTLKTTSTVQLDIFDHLGLHVATLASGTRSAGTYDHPFNATALPSGTYLVRLSGDHGQVVQPMVVVR